MKQWSIALLAAAMASGTLAADAQEARFTSAVPSPLKRSVFVAPNETRFSGSANVTGEFEVLWEPESDGFAGGFRVMFKPDAQSRRMLPHDVDRGPVREIWLRNTDEAISALITPAQKKQIVTSQRGLAGRATIAITSYRTDIDCDQRAYAALLVSVLGRATQVGSVARADDAFTC